MLSNSEHKLQFNLIGTSDAEKSMKPGILAWVLDQNLAGKSNALHRIEYCLTAFNAF